MEATELLDRDFFSLSAFGSLAEQTKPTITTITTYGGPPEFGSDPDSPYGSQPTAENEHGRYEEEEEDDEYVAELTRQMANYMLQDDEKHEKAWRGSDSPQSTLWSPFGSGYGSPIGPSREPSPPLKPAMEKFEKLKIKDHEINPVLITAMNNQSKQALIDEQIRSAQANFHKIKEEKEKEKRECRRQNGDVFGHRGRATATQIGCAAAAGYNGNYKRGGSGMKAVFLNGSGPGLRPGSVGTGVFLPRGAAAAPATRKKKGCSTVVIPARVIQALKLHFDKLGVPSRLNFDFPPHHDALLIAMNKNSSPPTCSGQRRSRQPPVAAATKAEEEPPADLPQEWTY